jgi:acyl phosphate:glycerol-3-phosphate acyltransferase
MIFSGDSILVFSFFIFSYFFGSVPFGLILTKMAGHGDIRKHGSGNIGATNVLRKSGKFIALLTLILDASKGAVAIFVTSYFFDDFTVLITSGLCAILGHIFPVWLRFKGGKGVATSFAVFLVLNLKIGIILCMVWLLILAIFRISGLSAVVTFALAPVVTYFITYDTRLVVASSIISTLVILRHYSNIKKLASRRF